MSGGATALARPFTERSRTPRSALPTVHSARARRPNVPTRGPSTPTHRLAKAVPSAPTLQAALEIGPPGDAFEREADRIADEVVRMPATRARAGEPSPRSAPPSRVQRACSSCEEELIQAKALPGPSGVVPDAGAVVTGLRGPGHRLPESVRAFFEPRLGYDLGGVRVHRDAAAATAASEVGARAFTVGRDVLFGQGEYAPDTTEGRRLLAHELVHTVQQGAVTAPEQGDGAARGAPRAHLSSGRAQPGGIQREVGKDLVVPSSTIIEQVNAGTEGIEEQVGERFDQFVERIELLEELVPVLRDLGLDVGPLESFLELVEPLLKEEDREFFKAALTDLVSLGKLSLDFNPGTLEDSPKNRFVYTCNCGWIDVGHFFFSATAAYAAGLFLLFRETSRGTPENILTLIRENVPAQISLGFGFLVELLQEAVRRLDLALSLMGLRDLLPPSVLSAIQGLAHSAFSIEDLPSDRFGAHFGQDLFKKLVISKANPLSFGVFASDIGAEMENEFFPDCGPVHPTGSVLDAMIHETICEDTAEPIDTCKRRQHFTTTPVLLGSARPLCPGGEVPPAVASDPVLIGFEKDRPQPWYHPGAAYGVSVTAAGKTEFDALVATLNDRPELSVQLSGNASIEKPAGDPSYNQRLTRERVRVILRELGRRGIDTATRVADPPGETGPAGCEELEEGAHACGDTRAAPEPNAEDRNVAARAFPPS